MSDFNFIPQGWECPKCKRVYSPTTMMCIACPNLTQTGTTGSSTTPVRVGVGVSGYGTTTSSSLCRFFVAEPSSGTNPKCINCGKSQLEHALISTTYEFQITQAGY
jgi:hypothetical protein